MPPSVCEPPESAGELLDSPLESGRDDRVVERNDVVGGATAPALPVDLAAGCDCGGFGSAFFAMGGLAGFAFGSGFAAFFAGVCGVAFAFFFVAMLHLRFRAWIVRSFSLL